LSEPILDNESICRHLRGSAFLTTASEETIQHLARMVEIINANAGEMLFRKGEIGSAMYFVVDGCVRIHDNDVVLTHLGVGEVFGEIGALASQARTASVTAEIDSALLKLDQEALYSTMSRQPDAVRSVINALCHRESTIIRDVTERSLKVQVLEREMAIGQKIQRSFLPDVVPDVSGWGLKGFLQPAREVAGDFYDFFVVPKPNCVGLVIGDVCDKGVGAALFMTLFRSLIRSTSLYRNFLGDEVAASDVISTLRHSIALTNKYIATTHGTSSMFASVFFGLLIPETGQLCYINAGHEAPLIVGGGTIRARLEPTGPVIGLFPDTEHDVEVVKILPDEILLAYTDGVTDAKNEFGEQYSEERLLQSVLPGASSAGAMLHKVVSSVEQFIGGASQYDDITVITAYREPHNK
jgi:sigma-B regulation protein RsbU (phosphoserine phosphatase)